MPWLLWATCDSAQSPLQLKTVSWCLEGTSCVTDGAHCLWFWHRIAMKRAWLFFAASLQVFMYIDKILPFPYVSSFLCSVVYSLLSTYNQTNQIEKLAKLTSALSQQGMYELSLAMIKMVWWWHICALKILGFNPNGRLEKGKEQIQKMNLQCIEVLLAGGLQQLPCSSCIAGMLCSPWDKPGAWDEGGPVEMKSSTVCASNPLRWPWGQRGMTSVMTPLTFFPHCLSGLNKKIRGMWREHSKPQWWVTQKLQHSSWHARGTAGDASSFLCLTAVGGDLLGTSRGTVHSFSYAKIWAICPSSTDDHKKQVSYWKGKELFSINDFGHATWHRLLWRV